MHSNIFLNLPIENLEKSRAFFSGLGYSFNDNFSDEKAACLVLGDNLFVMLLTKPFFKSFTNKEIADTQKTVAAFICVDKESREAVNKHVDQAVALGAIEDRDPQDYGFMYGRAFQDLDGHAWEIMWMDQAAAENGPPEA